jgi:hypothetical protein
MANIVSRNAPSHFRACQPSPKLFVAVSGHHFVLEDSRDLSDSSDDANFPDAEPNMSAKVRSQGDAALGGLEPFLLWKSGGDPQKLQGILERGQGMAGGQGRVSKAQPDPVGIVSKDPQTEST